MRRESILMSLFFWKFWNMYFGDPDLGFFYLGSLGISILSDAAEALLRLLKKSFFQ
jgi:hypothetical protein